VDLVGIVLAAGAGRRMGVPKALVSSPDGEPWLARATRALLGGGCAEVVVVLGARSGDALALLPDDPRIRPLVVMRWAEGLGVSLRGGLRLLDRIGSPAQAAVVTLVDLPGLTPAVVRRVSADAGEHTLRQAMYAGRPGHPVVLGRAQWGPLAETLRGDEGGRGYLRAHRAEEVECGDLADGRDVDSPHDPVPPAAF
jgi:CTP:molybdopterin cytidylyltransferase MocA